MRETGKRPRHPRDDYHGERSLKRQLFNKEKSKDEVLVVYRILCPDKLIGSVIGKGGKVINSIRQETNARVKIVDPYPGSDKRVITIYCHVYDKDSIDVDEEGTEPLCAAQDALLKVHAAIVNAVEMSRDGQKMHEEEALILVPASQAALVIGKSGTTIKRLRSQIGAEIKVSPKDPKDATHSCAMDFDNFVCITGIDEEVRKALYAVSAIMFKFPPKEEVSLDTSVSEPSPSIIIPSDVSMYPAAGFYPGAETTVSSARSVAPLIGAAPHAPDLPGIDENASAWSIYPSGLPVIPGYGGPRRSEELIVRVLCPSGKIGRVIGKGGSTIKAIRQSSGASVDVDDKKDTKDDRECIITVTSAESTEDHKSAAVEAVLLLQTKINDEDEERVNIRLLVPSKVIGSLIGKGGSIINDMRKKTKADIRISKGEKPKCASPSDELVEVSGEVIHVRDALAQIVVRLREEALREKEGINNAPTKAESAYSGGLSVPSVLSALPPVSALGYDQRVDSGRVGAFSASNLYGYSSLQAGESGYGSISSVYSSVPTYSSKSFGGLPAFFEMLIPANAVTKVLGKGGANLENIRKISGARIEIVDSKQNRLERIAQISGTPEQKRSAENLIQAFIMST